MKKMALGFALHFRPLPMLQFFLMNSSNMPKILLNYLAAKFVICNTATAPSALAKDPRRRYGLSLLSLKLGRIGVESCCLMYSFCASIQPRKRWSAFVAWVCEMCAILVNHFHQLWLCGEVRIKRPPITNLGNAVVVEVSFMKLCCHQNIVSSFGCFSLECL